MNERFLPSSSKVSAFMGKLPLIMIPDVFVFNSPENAL